MRFTILLASTLWALSAPLPKRENLYFYVQLFTLAVTECFLIGGSETTLAYSLAYEVMTYIILFTVIFVTVGEKPKFLITFIGCCAGLFVFLRAYEALAKPLRYFDWGYLFEGSIFVACGFMLVFTFIDSLSVSPSWRKSILSLSGDKCSKSRVILVLGLLWILLGVFRVGFVLQITSPLWLRLNWVVPSWLVIGAFILVGIYGRKERLAAGRI